MWEVGPENVVEYLHAKGHLPTAVPAEAELLAWGVSNVVLRIRPAVGEDFVVKQSRGQLRTQAAWFSRLDRILREMDLMRTLAPLLPPGMVPRVLFEDRENYLFGMEAVPADHHVWKADLLAGRIDLSVAARMGECLAAIHSRTAFDEDLQQQWSDFEVFDQLRIDPFYRRLAETRPELTDPVAALIDEMLQTRVCVVHADFSPKNILIAGERLALVDYETGHWGDPAFDLGFFLAHLMLKGILHAPRCTDFTQLARTFWSAYRAGLGNVGDAPAFQPAALERRTIGHLAGCVGARIDGKSPVDYLTTPVQQDAARRLCHTLFTSPPGRLDEAFARVEMIAREVRS